MKSATENSELSNTIAGTATLKIASIPTSNLFYTPIEERFERITRLARRALSVPVAAITLVNDEKQWFKSISGWNVGELTHEQSLCRWTIEDDRETIIEDTLTDPRTAGHPLVTQAPRFRFYAGVPIKDTSSETVGTLCCFDIKPRRMEAVDCRSLLDLSALAHQEFHANELTDAHGALVAKLSIARREAMMDPLTRLWNRRGATVMLQAACERARAHRSPLAVAVLDLDGFKRINDTYGHQIGDEALRRLGGRLIAALRQSDVCCRIGGDEFLLVMDDTDDRLAATVTERICALITNTPIATRQGSLPVGVSVGYTIMDPDESIDAEALIERADQRLLRSKAGKHQAVRAG